MIIWLLKKNISQTLILEVTVDKALCFPLMDEFRFQIDKQVKFISHCSIKASRVTVTAKQATKDSRLSTTYYL